MMRPDSPFQKQVERDCLIYDIEIMRCIPSANPDADAISPFEFCRGWEDHAGMGISCVACFDFGDMLYRTFLPDNLADFFNLAQRREYIVGYNSIEFDDRVCAANGFPVKTTYDLYQEIKLAAKAKKHVRGYKLTNVAQVNMFPVKEMTGDQAPILFQQKRFGELLDYCLRDVQLTKMIFDASRGCPITDPVTRGPLNLRTLFCAKHGSEQKRLFE